MRSRLLVVVLFAAASCSKSSAPSSDNKDKDKPNNPAPNPEAKTVDKPAVGALPDVAAAKKMPVPTMAASDKGVQPFLTSGGLSFVVPKKGWWANFNFSCMREMEAASPGGATALQMFEAKMPELFAAMRSHGIELHEDLHAMGAYACGEEMCMFGALHLAHPESFGEILSNVPGGQKTEKVDASHYVVTLPLPAGKRFLHVRWVPLDWGAVPDGSLKGTFAEAQRKATHLVIMYGVNEGKPVPDPFAVLAAPADAVAKVAAVEKLATPADDRCLVGDAGELKEDSFSDMKLRGAQFVVAAPQVSSDAAAKALGYSRSVDIEVVLAVDGKPSQADASRWVEAGKAWAGQTLAPVAGMMAGALGPHAADMGTLVEAAFKYNVEGNGLRLSFSTRNIPKDTLSKLGVQ